MSNAHDSQKMRGYRPDMGDFMAGLPVGQSNFHPDSNKRGIRKKKFKSFRSNDNNDAGKKKGRK